MPNVLCPRDLVYRPDNMDETVLHLAYKFKEIRGRIEYANQFRKVIILYKPIGASSNATRQSAC